MLTALRSILFPAIWYADIIKAIFNDSDLPHPKTDLKHPLTKRELSQDHVVEEFDFHTGRLLGVVDDLGLRDNSLVGH